MAKNSNKTTSTTTQTASTLDTPDVVIETTGEDVSPGAAAPAVESGLAVVEAAAPPAPVTERIEYGAAGDGTFVHLKSLLPHRSHELDTLRLVTREEFDTSLQRLTPVDVDGFKEVLDGLSTESEFTEAGDDARIRVQTLKLWQAAGANKNVPEGFPKGGIFADPNGEPFCVPGEKLAAQWKLPQEIRISVIFSTPTNIFFPPKDENDNLIALPEVPDARENVPICASEDRLVGFRFGDCKQCKYRPFAKQTYNKNDCKNGVTMFVVVHNNDAETSLHGLYKILVQASSFKSFSDVIRDKGGKVPFARQFTLRAELVTNEKKKQSYFIWRANLATDENNLRGIPNSEERKAMFALLNREIKTKLFVPHLAAIYDRASRKGGHGADDASPDALAATLGGTDYTNNVAI